MSRIKILPVFTAACMVVISGAELTAFGQQEPQPTSSSWRSVPPPRPLVLDAKRVPVREAHLRNGARVLVVERHSLPLVTVRLVVRGGPDVEPVGMAGLSRLVALAATKGSLKHPGQAFGIALDDIGATLDATSEADGAAISVTVSRDKLPDALCLLSEVLSDPEFADDTIAETRSQLIAEVRSVHLGLRHASLVARARLHGAESSYGRPLRGTVTTLERIGREDVLRFHRQNYVPKNVDLIVAGDVRYEEIVDTLNNTLTKWQARHPATGTTLNNSEARSPQSGVVLIDAPDVQQVSIAVGIRLPSIDSDEWPSAELLARALGGAYSSRLSRVLRQEKGVTYSVTASVGRHRGTSDMVLTMNVSMSSAGSSVRDVLDALTDLNRAPPEGAEALRILNTLFFDIAWDLDTTFGVTSALNIVAIQSLPANWLNWIADRWRSVKRDELKRIAAEWFEPTDAVIVVEGPLKLVAAQLEQSGVRYEIVSP